MQAICRDRLYVRKFGKYYNFICTSVKLLFIQNHNEDYAVQPQVGFSAHNDRPDHGSVKFGCGHREGKELAWLQEERHKLFGTVLPFVSYKAHPLVQISPVMQRSTLTTFHQTPDKL